MKRKFTLFASLTVVLSAAAFAVHMVNGDLTLALT